MNTIEFINNNTELNQKNNFRYHLGASQIGEPCLRKLWYDFRWIKDKKYSANILRIFETGKKKEIELVELLRKNDVKVFDVQNDGSQFSISAHNNFFGGSIDGVVQNLCEDEEDKTKSYILEIKTMNKKNFGELKKKGVEKAKYQHFAQMQIYMLFFNLPRAFYFVVCKDNDELYQEFVEFNDSLARDLLDKAKKIIESSQPCFKITENCLTDYRCKMCDYQKLCTGQEKKINENCRTCKNFQFIVEQKVKHQPAGSFCRDDGQEKTYEQQKNGCPLWQPVLDSLLPF